MPADVEFKFDNIIPRPVFDSVGNERNPSRAELVSELEQHGLWDIGEQFVIVGLSAAVGEALVKVRDARLASGRTCPRQIVKLEHPSFMMRRPTAERSRYAQRLGDSVRAAVAGVNRS